MAERADGSYSPGWRLISKIILRPLIPALMKIDGHGKENFPATGGMILAANHLSYFDVLALSLFADRAGRYPVFLAKSSLFSIKVLGPILRKLGQLPVYRGKADAALVHNRLAPVKYAKGKVKAAAWLIVTIRIDSPLK